MGHADTPPPELDRYVELLASENLEGAIAVARGLLDAGRSLDEVVVELVCAAQVEIGRRWERNEWTISQEHTATGVSEAVLDALLADGPGTATVTRGRLVAVCAEGEWHTMALRAVGEVVRRAGWQLSMLGPSVDAPQIGRLLHDVGPNGLLVSCSISMNLGGARRLIEASRATGTPVLAGGRGFGATGARATILGANAWASGPAAAIEALQRWEPYTASAPPLTHPGFADHLRLEAAGEVIADDVMASIARPPADVDVREIVAQLIRCTSAAALVDDAEVVGEFTTWLDQTVGGRALGSTTVDDALAALADATDRHRLPVATVYVRAELARRSAS